MQWTRKSTRLVCINKECSELMGKKIDTSCMYYVVRLQSRSQSDQNLDNKVTKYQLK